MAFFKEVVSNFANIRSLGFRFNIIDWLKRGSQDTERPSFYETDVGVKFSSGYFNSDRFAEYIEDEIVFESLELPFSDFLLPPDLLRNAYTNCGKSILESPHYQLLNDLDSGVLSVSGSNYLQRVSLGTLDARPPTKPDQRILRKMFEIQKKELSRNATLTATVVRFYLDGKFRYVIVDGKHRMAMAAIFDCPQQLILRRISRGFAYNLFFHDTYSYLLSLEPNDYSINQHLIRAIFNES